MDGAINQDHRMSETESLDLHVALCAERYRGIQGRLGRIESILLGGTGAILFALAAIAWKVAAP